MSAATAIKEHHIIIITVLHLLATGQAQLVMMNINLVYTAQEHSMNAIVLAVAVFPVN